MLFQDNVLKEYLKNVYFIGIGGIGIINFSYIDITVMIIASVLLFMFSYNDYKISKKEGILFLILFAVYYSYVIFS